MPELPTQADLEVMQAEIRTHLQFGQTKQGAVATSGHAVETFCHCWAAARPALEALEILLQGVPRAGIFAKSATRMIIALGDTVSGMVCPAASDAPPS